MNTLTTSTSPHHAAPLASSFTTTTQNPSPMARSWPEHVETAIEPAIQVRTLEEVLQAHVPQSDTLLGNRYLCRKGALIIIGPSGIGKSSSGVQMAMLWAMGKTAFDIAPARPLRILMVQAENDDGDLQEMVSGVLKGVVQREAVSLPSRMPGFEGFELGDFVSLPSDEQNMLEENLHFATITTLSGDGFIKALEPLLEKHPCDILWIDPLMAFLGGDPTNTERLMVFLRQQLTGLLQKHNIAAIISHHTPKTTNRDTSGWSSLDHAYAGAGAADITNWARAILAINQTKTTGTYKFIAAKRGARIGWKNEHLEFETVRYFQHSRSGGIFWEPGDADQVQEDENKAKAAARAKSAAPEPILRSILKEHPQGLDKAELLRMAQAQGAAERAARAALDAMDGELVTKKKQRAGSRPQIILRLKTY